ncbi:MAG TPA: YhzD family protein [Bacillota bacterium]|nr:YhzD family protein [Bacillota bacterium]
MKNYYITVFEKNGKLLIEKSFQAATDDEAKNEAFNFLTHEGYAEQTHRCVSEDANLLLFHR